MRQGDESGVLTANIGRDYIKKYIAIHNYYNDKEPFKYVPKKEIIKNLIDEEYNRLFEK